MFSRRLLVLIISVCLLASTTGQSAQAQGGVAEYIALVGVLTQLRANLDEVVNTVNRAMADRIHQGELVIDTTIGQLNDTIKKVNNGISVQREEIFEKVFETLAQTNQLIQDSSHTMFMDANNTLVSAATIISAIPGIKVRDYIFAAEPNRISSQPTNRQVSLYGFFPSVKRDGDAEVEIGNETIPLVRYTGNRLAFDIPTKYLSQQSSYIDMKITLPRFSFTDIFRPTIHNRVYVEKSQPFAFDIHVEKVNPELWVVLPAPRSFTDYVDNSRDATLSAADLFSKIVNDDQNYIMSSAVFVAMTGGPTGPDKPCHCCPDPSAAIVYWNPASVRYVANAPSCPNRPCGVFDGCGGGGSHVTMFLLPTFKVKKRGVIETIVAQELKLTAGRNSSQVIPFASGADWQTLEVSMDYKDGDDQLQDTVILSRDVGVKSTPVFSVRSDDAGQLILTTLR
jgi:hypothetical protein